MNNSNFGGLGMLAMSSFEFGDFDFSGEISWYDVVWPTEVEQLSTRLWPRLNQCLCPRDSTKVWIILTFKITRHLSPFKNSTRSIPSRRDFFEFQKNKKGGKMTVVDCRVQSLMKTCSLSWTALPRYPQSQIASPLRRNQTCETATRQRVTFCRRKECCYKRNNITCWITLIT